jgi:PAS domain S-box-containing protein
VHPLRAQLAPLHAHVEQALEDFPVAFCLCDSDGTVRWINPEMAALTGHVVGRHFNSFVAPESLETSARQFERKINGDASQTTYDLTIVDSAEQRIPVRIRSVPLLADEAVVGTFGALIPKIVPDGTLKQMRRRAPGLTPRQCEVLRLLAIGLSTTEMAIRLGISRETVRNHVRALLRELGAHSRLAAVAEARRQGWL